MNALQKLLDFLCRLDASKIYFELGRCRDEAILVRIDVPGERWEVEFFADGHLEVETFASTVTGIEDENALDRLFARFSN